MIGSELNDPIKIRFRFFEFKIIDLIDTLLYERIDFRIVRPLTSCRLRKEDKKRKKHERLSDAPNKKFHMFIPSAEIRIL
jgi:hypothetical protein